MQEIIVIGLNHKTALVETRECIAFSPEETVKGIGALIESPHIDEVLLLSTCNRVEIVLSSQEPDSAVEEVVTFISTSKNIHKERFVASLYIYRGDSAVRHVFRVAASLDSMMLGEPQILGQLKEAYRSATAKKTSGVVLNRLLHKTFSVAKRIRTETGIGDHAVSISYAAIELGKKIFGSLEGKYVLLIGAGEMAELALSHLARQKIGAVKIANRTFERALDLSKRFNGQAVSFEEVHDCLKPADIVIASTASTDYIVNRTDVKKLMRGRRNRPIFFIDIAVPRNIDPGINRIDNAYVYDIDDLKGVINENLQDRQNEAKKGERIVDEAVIQFRKWFQGLSVVPTIVELRKKIENIANTELEKTLHSMDHLSPEDCRALDRMVNALVKKILHDPTMLLKNPGTHRNMSIYLDIVRKLFNLDSF
ncbi:MAG: glutamyl-tRNA reductase [Desulfobacterales bacterium]